MSVYCPRQQMDIATTKLGKSIRDRREELGLSREGLAYKAGLAFKTIERIENGQAKPRRATVKVIEDALEEEAATV